MKTRFRDWRDLPYREIWVRDGEWYPGPGLANGGRRGDPITPLCETGIELRTGRIVQLWQGEFGPFPPYELGDDALHTSYMWTEDGGVFHRALGWGRARHAVCSYIEFRHLCNDARVKSGDRPKGFYSLAGAARYLKIGEIDFAHKEDMRDRILQGPPFTAEERRAIQAYNLDDARILAEIFKKLVPTIPSWSHALLRGEACWAYSGHEHRGVPLAPSSYDRIESHWSEVDLELVRSVDQHYQVYDIVDGVPHFRNDKFHNGYRRRHGIPWPRDRESGGFDMRGATWRDMALAYPQLADLHALRSIRSQMRAKGKLTIGRDYRNRTLLGPYSTKTSRCAWSTTKCIWGPSRGLRLAIAPAPGAALIHRDFQQEEPRIAAVKSGDTALLAACDSPEGVYLGVAHQLGFDERDDPALRARFKIVLLSIQYGAEAESLAIRAGISIYEAHEILARLRARFRRYEEYCASVGDHAGLDLVLTSHFGWNVRVPPSTNRRTIRNWPTQTTAAEIQHIAVILAERRRLPVIAPVHDALMAEGNPADIVEISRELDRCMGDASAIVLQGYRIPTEEGQAMGPHLREPRTGPIYPGEHYYDKAGVSMWNEINRLIDNLERRRA